MNMGLEANSQKYLIEQKNDHLGFITFNKVNEDSTLENVDDDEELQ